MAGAREVEMMNHDDMVSWSGRIRQLEMSLCCADRQLRQAEERAQVAEANLQQAKIELADFWMAKH